MNMSISKKILLITEFFPEKDTAMTGGVEARTYRLAKTLARFGCKVEVIARKRTAVTAKTTSLFPRLWFQFKAVQRGLKLDPGVVEGSNFVCYLPAYVLARIKRAKAVAWYADVYGKVWFETMSWPVALAGYVWEWISLHLPWDRIIAMSRSTRDKLIAEGVSPDKISVIYGGVDDQIIDKLMVKKFVNPTICTAARLVNYKHIDDLIQGFSRVQKEVAGAKLIIMGDGPERMKLERLSNKITTYNSVHFLGNLDQVEVWKVMKRSHVFCLPSTLEGFGLVTIEAMACGLPYVCADIPATREITEGGLGGYLYEPGNIEALTDCLMKALNDKPDGRVKTLVKKYSWDKITKQTLEAYLT